MQVGSKSIGWTQEQQITFYNEINKNIERIDVFLISKKSTIKNHTVNYIISQLQSEFSKKKLESWLRFLDSMLTECQEYRNQEVHKFEVNTFLETKLQIILPSFIQSLRWNIISILKNKPKADINDVFED